MRGKACLRLKLRELGCSKYLEPLLRWSALLLELILLALPLLFLLLLLLVDLCLAFLEEHLLVLVLPNGFLPLRPILQADAEVRQDVVSELIAHLEQGGWTLTRLILDLISEFGEHIH
jgi:hypothetical protein